MEINMRERDANEKKKYMQKWGGKTKGTIQNSRVHEQPDKHIYAHTGA